MTDPAIAVLPHGNKLGKCLAKLDLDALVWPLGRPSRLNSGVVADLAPSDHLIIFPKTNMHFLPDLGTSAHVSTMVVEPAIIHARHLRWLKYTYRRFFRVLTYHKKLLDKIPNGLFLPYGTTWVPEFEDLDLTKSKHISLIASAKRDHVGHQLRHRIVDQVQAAGLDVDILGRGYAPFDRKSEGLAPYRYSVVIENVREPNYFSEKLIDAVLCETVPIYWGCPNVDSFMDTSGMVVCHTQDALLRAIDAASVSQYDALSPGLKKAKSQAQSFLDLELRAAQMLKASL